MHVRDGTKIYTCRDVHEGKENIKGSPSKEEGEMKGDLLTIYLWTQGKDIIHDMNAVNTDATSYHSKTPEKCQGKTEKEKKKKYLDACLKQPRKFTPFVSSVIGLLGV